MIQFEFQTFSQVGPLSSLSGVMASFIVLLTLCHWKQLRKPYFALMKLLIIAAFLFGLSTLPWQQNFAGLIGGFLFGGGLTIAIVPFVYITKYNRKSKVNFLIKFIVRMNNNGVVLIISDQSHLDMHSSAMFDVCNDVHSILCISNFFVAPRIFWLTSKRSFQF